MSNISPEFMQVCKYYHSKLLCKITLKVSLLPFISICRVRFVLLYQLKFVQKYVVFLLAVLAYWVSIHKYETIPAMLEMLSIMPYSTLKALCATEGFDFA